MPRSPIFYGNKKMKRGFKTKICFYEGIAHSKFAPAKVKIKARFASKKMAYEHNKKVFDDISAHLSEPPKSPKKSCKSKIVPSKI